MNKFSILKVSFCHNLKKAITLNLHVRKMGDLLVISYDVMVL
jgi:hypothetical protein